MTRFRGIVVVAGTATGSAIVSDVPLSYWGGVDPVTGEVIDRRHPLSGACLSRLVLVLPHGRGSCSASGVLLESIRNGTAPAAIITEQIDPILALGSILGDEMYGTPIPIIAMPGFIASGVQTGQFINIAPDGSIFVDPAVASPTTIPT